MRNLVRKNGASFFLQGAEKRFYPDFLEHAGHVPTKFRLIFFKGAVTFSEAFSAWR